MPDPMVLGYLTSQYGRAADTFVRQEVRELRKLGHTVFTFSIRRPAREEVVSDEIRDEQSRTVYIVEAGALALMMSLLGRLLRHPLRTARAVSLAWRTRPPGAKALLWQLFYLAEAADLARRIDASRVQHVHNHIAMNSASVCMLAAEMSGVTWSMTIHGPHDLIEPERWGLAEKLASATFSVFISEFGRSQAMWHASPSLWPRLHVVRCGLDASFLASPAAPIPERPRLVFVGRLAPEKGAALLIEAAARLRDDGVRVELVLIGDGPTRREIEQAVKRDGLADTVTLLGWLDSERIRGEILASRALVLPSFAEGLPVVLMESLALHRPVVSTWVAGIPELVQSGVNGFLVPAGSVDDLADARRAVAEASTDQLAEMGRRGAQRVASRHDAAANVRQLEALLERAVHDGEGLRDAQKRR